MCTVLFCLCFAKLLCRRRARVTFGVVVVVVVVVRVVVVVVGAAAVVVVGSSSCRCQA